MQFSEIQRSYNAIFSLGQNCYPSIHLQRHRLRPFSGVFDWILSHSLKDVNRLLENKFSNFLNINNLSFVSYWSNGTELMLKDNFYNVNSAHDFQVPPNTPTSWPSYPEIKEKYKRRIERFFKTLETSEWILFVRLGGTYNEIVDLEKMLNKMVKHQFRLLVIADPNLVINKDSSLKYTYIVEHPITTELCVEPDLWDELFKGIKVIE